MTPKPSKGKQTLKIIRGMEEDCICANSNGKHTGYCDNYRFSAFLIKWAGLSKGVLITPIKPPLQSKKGKAKKK